MASEDAVGVAQHAAPPVLGRKWIYDVPVENAALATTGGLVWPAAQALCDFFEQWHGELELSTSSRALELGAGCGWLGMTLARNTPGLKEVVLTEQPRGGALEHLERNRAVAEAASVPLGNVQLQPLDLENVDSVRRYSQDLEWALVFGSDLVYTEEGARALPRAFRELSQVSSRMLYAHTLHRYDHLDLLLFESFEEAGLEVREIGRQPPDEEEFMVELFPEKRCAVYEIACRGREKPFLEVRNFQESPAGADEQAQPAPSVPDPLEPQAYDGFTVVVLPEGADVASLGPCPPEDVRLAVTGPFGNGSHPTTRLALRWLSSAVGRELLSGSAVCDYGSGTGVLGLAAMRCGAAACVAVDLEPASCAAARANASASAISMSVHLPPESTLQHDLDFYARFGDWKDREDGLATLSEDSFGTIDVVLCNIVVGPLCRVASTLRRLVKPTGVAVLAGMLAFQRAQVEEAYTAAGFRLEHLDDEKNWSLMLARPVRADGDR